MDASILGLQPLSGSDPDFEVVKLLEGAPGLLHLRLADVSGQDPGEVREQQSGELTST